MTRYHRRDTTSSLQRYRGVGNATPRAATLPSLENMPHQCIITAVVPKHKNVKSCIIIAINNRVVFHVKRPYLMSIIRQVFISYSRIGIFPQHIYMRLHIRKDLPDITQAKHQTHILKITFQFSPGLLKPFMLQCHSVYEFVKIVLRHRQVQLSHP